MTAYVYRLYDGADALLYIGCSNNVPRRVAQHLKRGTGGGLRIARWTVEEYEDRKSALIAELAAIRSEQPPFNQRGRFTGTPLETVGDEHGSVADRMAWRIARLSMSQGLNTLTLAKLVGIPLTRLSRLLRHAPGRIDVAELAAIASALGVTVVDLVGEDAA